MELLHSANLGTKLGDIETDIVGITLEDRVDDIDPVDRDVEVGLELGLDGKLGIKLELELGIKLELELELGVEV